MTCLFVSLREMLFHFNSHAHEGRDPYTDLAEAKTKNFNSHAHEGRDVSDNFPLLMTYISTHTPTRGVTK